MKKLPVLLLTLLVSLRLAGADSPPLGSFPTASGSLFRVWAPFAKSAAVAGEFSDWQPRDMDAMDTDGIWSLFLPEAREGQMYKFIFNGDNWKRDPRSRQVEHSDGNSILYDPAAFDWGAVRPPEMPREDLVLYQLHVGTFAGCAPPATFDDAISRLDYLSGLGITGIQLMPVNEFPGGLSWGYNPADLFAIESDYGGPDALKRFVRAAHARGMVVLADIVHNHYGPTDLDLWRFDGWHEQDFGGIYFYCDSRIHTPWGSTRPDFGRPEVRAFIRDQVFMFLEEYRLDGFRWDSVYNILHSDHGFNPQGRDMLREINMDMAQTHPHALRVAEDTGFEHDLHFQAQWDIGHRWALFNQLSTAHDPERDMHTIAGTLTDWPGFQRVIFTEAHDYVAHMNDQRSRVPSMIHPDEPESIWARKRALLGAAMIFTTPGIPMIFQGQEMLETQAFHDDTPLRWERAQSHAGTVRAYTDLIRLRRNLDETTPGLRGDQVRVDLLDNERKLIAFSRWQSDRPDEPTFVVANFSAVDYAEDAPVIPFPAPGLWQRRFNSDSTAYAEDFGNLGPESVVIQADTPAAPVPMGRYSLQIFSKLPPAE
ncbi:MAG: DUF3459 domain-containing protein [Lentisphaerae bacterium]|jgi:1,4-alpha-glucan branching enzyme|nr:DUF3459 domain-containing protein [Lentisphaerota bacterium]